MKGMGESTGKRKKVTMGEPTSGLDSTSKFLMVSVLQGIARAGRIVILNIHQPSSRSLSPLHLLIILFSGHMVYGGSPTDLSEFFTARNHPIPEYKNRTEFALDLISKLEEFPDGITNWLSSTNHGTQGKPLECMPPIFVPCPSKMQVNLRICKGKILTSVEFIPAFVNPFYVEIYVVVKRSQINSRRMPESFGYRFGAVILRAVMLGTILWQSDDSPRGAQERLGFFASAVIPSLVCQSHSLLHPREMHFHEGDHEQHLQENVLCSGSLYSVPPSICPARIRLPHRDLLARRTSRWAHGFPVVLQVHIGRILGRHSFVTFIFTVVPNVMTGYLVVLSLLAQFMLFGGFFISRDRRVWIPRCFGFITAAL